MFTEKNMRHLKVKHCVLFRGLWAHKPGGASQIVQGDCSKEVRKESGYIGVFATMTK